ncbi:MAG TPA: AAA family ATPase [Candidatus Nanoarchaeia archaeon]|nr:AAA family ATPase [Candidatus Nanoarchaeia archaeon]
MPNTALINIDKIKWMISDYKLNNDFYLKLSNKIVLDMVKRYLSNRINVIIEKAFCKKENIYPFLKYANEKDAKVLIYNIEAPWKIINKRLKTRKHKMTTKKGKRIYKSYSKNKFSVNKTFDTSKTTQKKIINSIISDIK